MFKRPSLFLSLSKYNLLKRYYSMELKNKKLLRKTAFVNGEWVTASTNKQFEVYNPSNGEVIGTVPDLDVEDAQKALVAAREAFASWQNTTAKERSEMLRKWYELLQANAEDLANIMTAESGKPLAESRGEVTYGNSFVQWFSEQARNVRGEIVSSPVNTKKIFIEHQPIGVAALITPWNFPHAMITRKAGAALAAGCTCVVKPAEDTPYTALALAVLADEAGLPKGVFNVITSARSNAPAVGKLLCESPLVAGISFTGSTDVGRLLYRQCAAGIKRIGLELGGNAPFIVFDTADVDLAVTGAMASKFRNCGQTCVSSNRFIVQESVYDAFIEKMVVAIKALTMGDGFMPDVQLGPLINKAQADKVADFVDDALDKGAKCIVGGKAAKAVGELFYEPSLLVDVTEDMKCYNDEVFGPVVTCIKFATEEEAVRIANSTRRGLAGYFYSSDVAQIFRVSKALEMGMVGINEGIISSAEAPFGGVKESGVGREGSHHGVDDYLYIKYVCLGNL